MLGRDGEDLAGAGLVAAVAGAAGGVAAGAVPVQGGQGGVQVLLVLLDGEDVVGEQVAADEVRELALGVQRVGGDHPAGQREPGAQAEQHGPYFRDLVGLGADLALGDHGAAGGGGQQERDGAAGGGGAADLLAVAVQ